MDHDHPGFVPFPMHLLPMPVPQRPDYHGNEVPARVRVALQLLDALTAKTMTRGMVNDVGFDTIDGQQLEVEERAARHDALQMLRLYFGGMLAPSQWEACLMESHHDTATVIDCPKCGGEGPGREACRYCGGKGKVMIQ